MSADNLSLQSLKDAIENKADKDHTHAIAGNIESALMLNGVTYDKFIRNNISDQTIDSNTDNNSLSVKSNTTTVAIKSGDNRARLEIDNADTIVHNLTISGVNNEDVMVGIVGKLFINDSPVLTLNEKNEITGVDLEGLDIDGHGIIVSRNRPVEATDGTIWGQVVDEDLVNDDTAIANHNLYTVPIGTIVRTLASVAPNGYLPLNGKCVSRTLYRSLWSFARSKAQLIPDSVWKAKTSDTIYQFSYGDGVATFRLPKIPTNDLTMYVIKAYDELSTRDVPDLSALQNEIDKLKENQVETGVGYKKYPDGGLTQYGTVVGTDIQFPIPFLNAQYVVVPVYEGSSSNVNVTISSKTATQFSVVATDGNGSSIDSPTISYIAEGRWK